jgi:hypothetical protein
MMGQVKWREKSPLSEMDDWLFENMVRANQAVRCPAERLLLSKRRLHFRLSIES